ncbi:MAG: copper resistance protein CopC [Gemmatimonadota bacterium]
MRFPVPGKPTRPLCLAAFAAVFASAAFGPGELHLRLESSEPAAGSVVGELPPQVRLVFSAAIERSLADVRLTTGDGGPIPVNVWRDSADDRVLLGTWPELSTGTWEVAWKVVSLDGHTVRGTFEFTYDTPEAAESAAVDAAEAESSVEMGVESGVLARPDAEADPATFPWFGALLGGAARWFLLAFAGLAWFDRSRRVERGSRPGRLTRSLAAGAVVFVAAYVGHWIVSAGAFGEASLGEVLTTRTGRLGLLQLALTAIAAAAAFGWRLRAAATFAILAILVDGATGHPAAAGNLFAASLSAAHMAAGAIWLGGLLLIIAEDRNEHHLVATSRAVSRAAFVVSILVGVTGLGMALLLVPSLSSVFSTAYGRLVLAKIVGFGILIAFGAHHKLRIIPVIETEGTGGALQRSVRKEALVFMLVILLAAVLGQTTLPA